MNGDSTAVSNGVTSRAAEVGRAAIRILIASDIRLYRDGLAEILRRNPRLRVAVTAADREEVLTALRVFPIDMILLDMAMPESIATVLAVRAATPSIAVLALTVAETDSEVLACAEAGVAGYVLRNASPADLVTVMESVARGEVVCSPRIAATLLRRVTASAAQQGMRLTQGHLTQREREIVRLIDQGLSNKEIAKELSLEVATVKNHVHNLLEKLRVHRRADAAALLHGRSAPPLPRLEKLREGN